MVSTLVARRAPTTAPAAHDDLALHAPDPPPGRTAETIHA
jgi:hypothetical protein